VNKTVSNCSLYIAASALTLILADCSFNLETAKVANTASVAFDVDTLFPGPNTPRIESKQIVSFLQTPNVLNLANGETIAPAGVKCDTQMFAYMQALFFGNEPDFLLYELSGYSESGVRYAYIWGVSPWELGDPDLEFSPITTSLNETGVRSGWCFPVEQDYHRYHDRYMALSKLVQ